MTSLDMIWFMMAQHALSISFYGSTLLSAAYLLNCVPSKLVNTTFYDDAHPMSHEYALLGCSA